MSKRQIKAKRWLRKKLNREYAYWEWSRSANGKLLVIADPVVVDGQRAEDALHFPEQVRILGDGTVQYRWGFYANTFSWKRYKSSLRNEAWRNR